MRLRLLVLLPCLLVAVPAAPAQPAMERALASVDSLVRAAADSGRFAGAVLLVARDGVVLHHAAYGYAQRYGFDGRPLPAAEPMTTDHLFDLASLTKVMATTFTLMRLVDEGRVDLAAPVARYLPGFRGPGKDSVTVRHLLTHTGGLAPWEPVYYHARTPEAARAYVEAFPLAYPVGRQRRYSDLGFMLLGYLVEEVSGRPLGAYVDEAVFAPLGLRHTSFEPLKKKMGPFAATSHGNPFERRMVADDTFGYVCDEDPAAFQAWRAHTLAGEVNDGNAFYAHGGTAGHAGLFATAADLRVLLDVLLDVLLGDGRHEGRPFVRPETVRAFLTPDAFGNGLGWWMAPGTLGLDDAPPGTFGHRGFTGTWALAAPACGLSVVLLTNRQHVGVDARGYYPDLGDLQRQVAARLFEAACPPGTAD